MKPEAEVRMRPRSGASSRADSPQAHDMISEHTRATNTLRGSVAVAQYLQT
jgi:hypothetical protein